MTSMPGGSFTTSHCRCLSLRRAQAGDHKTVAALLRASQLPIEGVAEWLDSFWVAEHQGAVVGVAGMERYGDGGLLRSVAVAPDWRGTGVGRALVDRVLDEGRAAGVREVYLLTTTAEHYFPRLGFACVDRETVPPAVRASAEFTGACPASAIVMRRVEAYRVLFLCTGNSARSQMAEAVLNRKGRGRFIAESAGSNPAEKVNPYATRTLRDFGIEWDGHPPRGLTGLDRERWDFVITVCDRAREACPVFPGQPVLAHWGMPDPATVEGDDATKQATFAGALTLINRRIDLLLAVPVATLDRLVLEAKVRAIGQGGEVPLHGHGELPYEQKTQQSPGSGVSTTPQAGQS